MRYSNLKDDLRTNSKKKALVQRLALSTDLRRRRCLPVFAGAAVLQRESYDLMNQLCLCALHMGFQDGDARKNGRGEFHNSHQG